MATEDQKKEYQHYVEEVTPAHNTGRNLFRAFWTGGIVCVIGQLLGQCFQQFGMDKETAGTWTLVVLVLLSIVLTAFHVFGKITKYAGAGVLVPITGFANGVAAPAVEFAPEGEVFGKGVQIFTIAGPVILYGVFASWVLGLIYWVLKLCGVA